jgi:hypothetical protein
MLMETQAPRVPEIEGKRVGRELRPFHVTDATRLGVGSIPARP